MEITNTLNPEKTILNIQKEFIQLSKSDKISIEDFFDQKLKPYQEVYNRISNYKILPRKFKSNFNFLVIEEQLMLSNIKIDPYQPHNKRFESDIYKDGLIKILTKTIEDIFFRVEQLHTDYLFNKIDTDKGSKNIKKTTLSNPKKLALLTELGIFDLPIMRQLSEDNQNEIIALLLDANKIEFVYKNRLNINSKNPVYQIDKYTSFQYLDDMRKLLEELK